MDSVEIRWISAESCAERLEMFHVEQSGVLEDTRQPTGWGATGPHERVMFHVELYKRLPGQ
jgi:hypothetical protein